MRLFQYIIGILSFLLFVSCSHNLITPLEVKECTFTAQSVEVIFSATVNQYQTKEAFSLKNETDELKGTFRFNDDTLFFYPDEGITDGNRYTLTISTGAEDIFGNSLMDKYVYIHDTKTDFTSPEIVSISPSSEMYVPNQVSEIEINFSEEVNEVSFRDALSISPSIENILIFAADRKSVRIVPVSPLKKNTRYTVTVSKELTDLYNNHLLNEFSSTFTNYEDTTAPEYSVSWDYDGTQIEISEQNENHNLLRDAVLTVSFNEKIDINTVTSHISLYPTVNYTITPDKQNSDKITIEFTNNVDWGATYTLIITEGIKDLADNSISERKQYELIFDNEKNKPIQLLSCYLDLLENAGPYYYAELSLFSTLTFNVEKFPLGANNTKNSHLFMLFSLSSQASGLNLFSIMKALAISCSNSCADIEIKTIKLLTNNEIAEDPYLQSIKGQYSQNSGFLCMLDACLEISNTVSKGIISVTLDDNLRDNLGNSMISEQQIIFNKQ